MTIHLMFEIDEFAKIYRRTRGRPLATSVDPYAPKAVHQRFDTWVDQYFQVIRSDRIRWAQGLQDKEQSKAWIDFFERWHKTAEFKIHFDHFIMDRIRGVENREAVCAGLLRSMLIRARLAKREGWKHFDREDNHRWMRHWRDELRKARAATNEAWLMNLRSV